MRPVWPRRRYQAALAIDKHVGRPLCGILYLGRRFFLRKRKPPLPDERVTKVLVVKMWGMGSIVLATPLIEEIHRRYPNARVDFLSLQENFPILGLYPGIDRILTIDLSRGIPLFLVHTVRTLLRLRRERYDLLLDLEFFTRFSSILSRLTKARWTHGFSARDQ